MVSSDFVGDFEKVRVRDAWDWVLDERVTRLSDREGVVDKRERLRSKENVALSGFEVDVLRDGPRLQPLEYGVQLVAW